MSVLEAHRDIGTTRSGTRVEDEGRRLDLFLPKISADYIENFRRVKGYSPLISKAEVSNGIIPSPAILGEDRPTTFSKKIKDWVDLIQKIGFADMRTVCDRALKLQHQAAIGDNEERARIYDTLDIQTMLLSSSSIKTRRKS